MTTKFKEPSRRTQQIERILINLQPGHGGKFEKSPILGGQPGVGKTATAKMIGKLLGITVVQVETPHMVEEHVVELPFIIIKPDGSQKTIKQSVNHKLPAGSAVHKDDKHQFDISFANSHLYTTINDAKHSSQTDAQLLASVKKFDSQLLEIWTHLGGDEKEIPDIISDIRKRYTVLLFLDEYFRQTTENIQNMLRSIQDGFIGSRPFPKHVVPMYASNFDDEGIQKIQQNARFSLIDFNEVDTDDWVSYIRHKYKNDTHVKLNEELLTEFGKLLKKENAILHNAHEEEVSISPRRWEQLFLYINANLPVKSKEDADLLLKNVQISFKNYKSGAVAKLANHVIKFVNNFIERLGDKSLVGDPENVDLSSWYEVLRHQIETNLKLEHHRKYIPVVCGPPGAGKTKRITQLAFEFGLIPVMVHVFNLSAEDVVGIAKPRKTTGEEGEDSKINIDFSPPPLYVQIQQQIEDSKKVFKESLLKAFGKEKGEKIYAQHQKQNIKYLFFFDELNRTSPRVFNVIRKVLLEKEFDHTYQLPKNSIFVAAINPAGGGTHDLTKHMADVIDPIHVGVSWNKFISYINSQRSEYINDYNTKSEIVDACINVFKAFVEKFRQKTKTAFDTDPHFFIHVGNAYVYVSSRDYEDIIRKMIKTVKIHYKRELKYIIDHDGDAAKSEQRIRGALADSIIENLKFIKTAEEVDSPEFLASLKQWFLISDELDIDNILLKKKVKSVRTLGTILDEIVKDHNKHLFEDVEFVNYLASVDIGTYKDELVEFLYDKFIKDIENVVKVSHPSKTFNFTKKMIEIEKQKITQLEFMVREIVHAIHAHDLSHQLIEATSESVTEAFEKVSEKNMAAITKLLPLTGSIWRFVSASIEKAKAHN